ncbi:MAG: CHASE3 domain-containing protein [Deltaproteobacteria bacterium]|nr:CHASE3 domain-containing protein [Deltaproteobacteria bacterium]
MGRLWTFGQKLSAGFASMVVLVLIAAAGAIYALDHVAERNDRVIAVEARNLILAGELRVAAEWKASALRGYLLLRDDDNLGTFRTAREQVQDVLTRIRAQPLDADSARLLDDVERTESAHQGACEPLIVERQATGTAESTGRAFQERALPKMKELRQQIETFAKHQERQLEQGSRDAAAAAARAKTALIALVLLAVLVAVGLALALSRALGHQIGSAVQHVQSSSSELQTAANQQASGTREQSSAMSEITTTISELLATSRQIAESAQRVARIAEDTAKAARAGELTVGKSGEQIGAIKRQVDLIVAHMLDLGRKSQQIGGILEIVNELAEQTNILAINATIEAAGAGEAGRRFAVVADEIRKLADRVGGSTKEIRGLIEEIRAAVNTTVMTTEAGTKAVDTGTRQFLEVAVVFKQIVSSVGTTTDAAREIELSTKQQATAIEQVNIAIANVAQATRETEASAGQTLQTASQLTGLSKDLLRLVQPQADA